MEKTLSWMVVAAVEAAAVTVLAAAEAVSVAWAMTLYRN
jgi:hypothetical protein